MNQYASMIRSLKTPEVMERLLHLYGNRDGMLVEQTARYTSLLKRHEEYFHAEIPVLMVSAPGRTEIGGNHTDHNRGRVLAASVNLDTLAAVSAREDMVVHVHSDGYPAMTIDLASLDKRPEEEGTTAALIRGVAARMAELDYKIGGFDAVITSTVASGSGLSSSAAFEVMTCAILDALYNGFGMDSKVRAKIGQYAENVYFGKPSGLLDQMASAFGGLVTVDFRHDDPDVRPMSYDFARKGYALVVVGTGGSHDDLTDEYAAIPAEMKQVAAALGASVLREIAPKDMERAIPQLKNKVSDRAILRALHFYDENERVDKLVAALEDGDITTFFEMLIASGESSWKLLQNLYVAGSDNEEMPLALELSRRMLEGCGAWRIHGGGFAGTILVFLPKDMVAEYTERMNAVFGEGAVTPLMIRADGAVQILY